jgi:3',5'-cyclic AMP phosphodiesterase CpdA
MRLAHLSDLHFGRHDPRLAETLVRDLQALAPDLVVVSGDFTQDGTVAEFAQARDFLAALSLPTFCVPGNHDVPARNLVERLSKPYGRYRSFIAEELEPFLEMGDVAIGGVNTSRAWRAELNWAHGSVNRRQLNALAERFERSEASVRIVVAHHPLLLPDTPFGMRVVRRANEALEALARLRVSLVMSGHFHLAYVREYGAAGEVFEGQPSAVIRQAAGKPILVSQAASAISTRLRGEPNAYNWIEIDGDRITATVRLWNGEGWRAR